jgi:gluconolactonase
MTVIGRQYVNTFPRSTHVYEYSLLPRGFLKLFLCLTAIFAVSVALAQSPVPSSAMLETVASGFQFVEGPVWSDSIGLLFSDLSGNTVYQWRSGSTASAYLKPSSNSNGLTFDAQGRLILAQTGLRRVARRALNGTQTSLASLFNGKKLNSPNDLVVKSDGSIFFTDPPFNIPTGEKAELSFSGVFRINPAGNLQLLDSSLALPNGICFSPDETKLYVDNSSERVIYVWDVIHDSTLANKRRFASISPSGYADGMKVDASGNLFCAGPLGIWVFAPNGQVLDTILVPGQTSNCNWGDADRKTLYITSGTSVYRIRLATTGIEERGDLEVGRPYLHVNYPNPFNPNSDIRYQISDSRDVRLSVHDLLGREVAVLVNERKSPGSYTVTFYASTLASGVYLYSLAAGQYTETKRMVLVR